MPEVKKWVIVHEVVVKREAVVVADSYEEAAEKFEAGRIESQYDIEEYEPEIDDILEKEQ